MLTDDEKAELTRRIFGQTRFYRGRGLYDWEETWFADRLPRAPARVLVGGAGGGREAAALVERGYVVDAFDPSAPLVDVARERVGPDGRVAVAGYEDLAADRMPAGLLRPPYDAALLGWGSLMHVLAAPVREALFRRLDALCPRGPILASFYWRPGRERPRPAAWERGRRLGRWLVRARRLAPQGDTQHLFGANIGFGWEYTRAEVEALAAACGRTVVWEKGGAYPHVTLPARTSAASSPA